MITSCSPVLPEVFEAITFVDVDKIVGLKENEVRPILACLVRMSLISPLDQTADCVLRKKRILGFLSSLEQVNSIVSLLSANFHSLEADVKKEQSLR